MKRLTIALLVALTGSACSSGLIVRTSFCAHLGELRDTVQTIAKGSEPVDEIAKELDHAQSVFTDDASTFDDDGDARMAAVARDLAKAIGNAKVAASTGANIPVDEVTSAINAVPSEFCS